MGFRKLLIFFACLLFVSCSRGNVSAPIVNTIRLEDGNLFLLLNNIKPKGIRGIKNIGVADFTFDEIYFKNLKIDIISNYHGRVNYYLLRTKGMPDDLFVQGETYIIDINAVRIEIKIEVEFKDGAFRVLSEEYSSFPEYHKWEHYKNYF